MKIFVLRITEAGEQSCIAGTFSTAEKAAAYAKKIVDNTNRKIFEFITISERMLLRDGFAIVKIPYSDTEEPQTIYFDIYEFELDEEIEGCHLL